LRLDASTNSSSIAHPASSVVNIAPSNNRIAFPHGIDSTGLIAGPRLRVKAKWEHGPGVAKFSGGDQTAIAQ
jgi:hypothetical protein